MNRRDALDHRDRLDLDQELLLHQPVDDEERVRRVFVVGEHLWIVLLAPLIEPRDVLRVHEEGGELHHIAPAAGGGLERLLDLRIDRRALRFEGFAGRDDAGDVQRLAALDARASHGQVPPGSSVRNDRVVGEYGGVVHLPHRHLIARCVLP